MPVPYRDLSQEAEARGVAAFLRVVPENDEGGYLGALFLINALGEPVEFTYNRIDVLQRFLWRRNGLRRHAARRLAASLLDICPRVPDLLFCLADEVEPELFAEGLEVSIPVARIAKGLAVVGQAGGEERELVETEEPLQLFWQGSQPAAASPERVLVERLASRGLLLEPFARAGVGLDEVYSATMGDGGGDTSGDVVG